MYDTNSIKNKDSKILEYTIIINYNTKDLC